MGKKKLGEKTVDELLEEIERDLKRLDEKIEEQGHKIKDDVKGFEKKFKEFVNDPDIDIEEIRGKAGEELERLRKELDFTAKALKDSFNYFRAQYKNRKNTDQD